MNLGEWNPIKRFVVLYVVWRVWLFALVATVLAVAPPDSRNIYLAKQQFAQGLPQWITTWGNFDGMVFMRIAHGGYGSVEVAFFPLLPWLMRWISGLSGMPYISAGMLVSLISFGAAVYYARKLWQLDRPDMSFLWFGLVMLSFPTAHYYTAVYQDALFLAASTATLWYARQHRWVWAVIAAMVGMLARLNGLALLVILAAEYFLLVTQKYENRWDIVEVFKDVPMALHPKRLFGTHRFVWLFLLIPAVFVGYLGFLQAKFGDWHIFFSSVEIWNRDKLVFPFQTFWRYAKILYYNFGSSFVYIVAVLEAAFTALYSVVLVGTWGKIRLTYWWWMLAHFLIPVVSGTLQGMPRYGLQVYPLFLVLATVVSKQPKWVRVAYFAGAIALQVWYVIALAQGKFVA